MKGRASLLVRVGRYIQKYYHFFSFLDYLVIPLTKKRPIALLCILAPPRSGSTLTYQVLTTAIDNMHLTNLSNLLYATPVAATMLEKKFCQKHHASFASTQGFVDGLCGEAEGLKFWSYWMGQGLSESPETINEKQLRGLYNRLQHTGNSVYITGYLGHVFSIETLRKVFDKVLFVHLERDLLSNSYSLYKLSGESLYSTKPVKCQTRTYHSLHEQVVDQVMEIHTIIKQNRQEDMIKVSYEALCDEPDLIIKEIVEKAEQKGIFLKIKRSISPFRVSCVSADKNQDTQKLDELIKLRGE